MLKWKEIILSIIFMVLVNFHSTAAQAEMLEFAQVSDIHYTYGNTDLDKSLYFLNLSIKNNNLDFAVFLGNNVDKSTEDNVIGLMRCLYPLRVPYYVVFGNNDTFKFGGIEKDAYLDIVTTFNHNQKDGQNYYYFMPNSDFIGVVLDNTSYFEEVQDEQLEWLDNLLAENPNKMFMIFQHSPINPFYTEKYKNILSKYSNIVLMSSGYYHQDSVTQDEKGVWHISAPAFGIVPHSYQMIKITYDEKKLKSPKNVKVDVVKIKV